jgi:ADP-L-glycero-D-manno-heptose 6-epimerase
MIIVTGGAGFIGSNIIKGLNDKGIKNIIVVDKLRCEDKWKNLVDLKYTDFIDKDIFLDLLFSKRIRRIHAIIHIGACSSTTEKDSDYLLSNNYLYSKNIFIFCKRYKIPLIYASSAATYGDGSRGYDDHNFDLKPLNMYGYSKKIFDDYVLSNFDKTFQCVGLKFFNVYGPYEYHKKDMASMIFHSYHQIKKSGKVRLFKSDRPDYKDGEQKRDFIYVKDVVKVVLFFLKHKKKSGIFNLGTGISRSFNDLVKATFNSLGKRANIEYIDMPLHLKGKYQYFTQAEMNKLRKVGYREPFYTLEEGADDYVKNHLLNDFP